MTEKSSEKYMWLYLIAALLMGSLPALLILTIVFGFVFGISLWTVFTLICKFLIPLVCLGIGLWLYPKITEGKSENWWIGVSTIAGLFVLGIVLNGHLNANSAFYNLLVSWFGGFA